MDKFALCLLAVLFVFAPVVFAADRTIPARTYDDVTGLPVVSKQVMRDGATSNWFMTACFVARTNGGQTIPLKSPCSDCYGPDNNATEQLCRAKVIANPDNGI